MDRARCPYGHLNRYFMELAPIGVWYIPLLVGSTRWAVFGIILGGKIGPQREWRTSCDPRNFPILLCPMACASTGFKDVEIRLDNKMIFCQLIGPIELRPVDFRRDAARQDDTCPRFLLACLLPSHLSRCARPHSRHRSIGCPCFHMRLTKDYQLFRHHGQGVT